MRADGARILVNLAALRRGGGLTHVAGFLPELVRLRSADRFQAVVPAETADLVAGWGIATIPHHYPAGSPALRLTLDQVRTRRAAGRADLLLSPLNHGPVAAPVPQILWACNMLYFRRASGAKAVVNGGFARAAMRQADLVVYPTASARSAAERAGVAADALILRHPLRPVPPSTAVRPRRAGAEPLRVLVPASNHPHKNLALLPRISRELDRRGVDHRFTVTAELPAGLVGPSVTGGFRYERAAMGELVGQFDVVLIPSVTESYSYPLVEFEMLGIPVAASRIETHVELRARAWLFDPASPSAAAHAIEDAAAAGRAPADVGEDEWRFNSPHTYAAAVSREMDRLLGPRP